MIEIKSRYGDQKVLFKSEKENVKEAVVDAVSSRAYLSDADLGCANLGCANLRGANLRGANLRGANLRDADLSGAYLSDADLGCAYLRGANLRGANLRGANLRGANLRGANLRGANLRGADLGGADLIDAGQDSRGYRFVGALRNDVRVLAGCRDFTLIEAREHWGSNPEALAKIALIETIAALRGWVKGGAQ